MPTDEEVATPRGLTVAQVGEVRAAARAVTSLDQPIARRPAARPSRTCSRCEEEDVEQEVTISLPQEALRRRARRSFPTASAR